MSSIVDCNPALNVSVGKLTFKNPIIAASGTFGFGREYAELFDISRLGGIATKGLTPLPRQGNPSPRIAETPMGMLNAVGLQNPGLEAFLRDELPPLLQRDTRVIVNAAGSTLSDYEMMAERLSETEIDAIELNISCPNVKEGGVAFGVAPASVERVTKLARAKCLKPLWVKLSPNVADIAENAKAAESGGADAVTLVNTLTGMAVDIGRRRPVLANVTGGLSGPAIKPIALHMVHRAYKAVKIPVVGMGGVSSGRDVFEFMLCGASAVMVGTAGLADPIAWLNILDEFNALLVSHSERAAQLTGALMVD